MLHIGIECCGDYGVIRATILLSLTGVLRWCSSTDVFCGEFCQVRLERE